MTTMITELVVLVNGMVMIWRWWDRYPVALVIAGVQIGSAATMLALWALG